MKKGRHRFDVNELRELAGEKVFARGEAYHRNGQVQILALEPDRVLAKVEGTEDYRTVLAGRGKDIDGECSCPAFEDWGFCKHMVAVALAANAVGGGGEAKVVGALGRIRDHLKKKSVDALVEVIVELAGRDSALFRRLDMASAASGADDKTLEAHLSKAIDTAVVRRHYIDYRSAPGWAADVAAILDTVAELVPGECPGVALKLAERAIWRIERAIESIDDSDGHCGSLLDRARDIHLAAARAMRPEPKQLARDLFAREMEGEYDTFSGAAELYVDVLGEPGLAEYRRLAFEAWDKLPTRSGRARKRDESDEFHGDYYRLSGIVDFFAERDGDVEARIAVRAKDLSSSWGYWQLAEFCRSQGREAEALRYAEEGLWLFEDEGPDERLVRLTTDLLLKAGRESDAESHLWRAFKKSPSLELYDQLQKTSGRAARGRVVEFLEMQLANAKPTPWHHPADILIDILMQENTFEPAWQAVHKHGASLRLKERLARASDATHCRDALKVYGERVEQLVDNGGNQGYETAAELISRMATIQSAAEHAAYVAALKARFGRRRNFMKLLG